MKKFYSLFCLLMLSVCAFAADVVIEPSEGKITISASDVDGMEDGSQLIVNYTATTTGTINFVYGDGSLAVQQVWVFAGSSETTVELTGTILSKIKATDALEISANNVTLTKATIKNNDTDVTGDVVGDYFCNYNSGRKHKVVPVTITKATNKTVKVNGLGADFIAKVTKEGLFVDKQLTEDSVTVSGRTISTWHSTYDEESQTWKGGWDITYHDSTTFYLNNGYYSMNEGIQIGSGAIYDGILYKQDATLPGESYILSMSAYENTGFDVEAMKPIVTYSTITDNIRIIKDEAAKTVTLLGANGHSEMTGTIDDDGTLRFAYDGTYIYGPWDGEAGAYGDVTFAVTDNGYATPAYDESSYAYFIYSYFTGATLTKGGYMPADALAGNYSMEYIPSNKYNGSGKVRNADVTIEKINDYKVKVKGMLTGYDFDAYVGTDGSITVYDQIFAVDDATEVVVGGRKTITWKSTYDEATESWNGGYVQDLNNNSSTFNLIGDGIYELSDGVEYTCDKTYDENRNTIYSAVKDGLLIKKGATLPGETYTMLVNSYENTGFDVEKMQPIATYYEDKDNINIAIDGDKFTAYGVFGRSVMTGTIAEDGTMVFDLEEETYGSYETDENWNYTYYPVSFAPQADGSYMSTPADGYFIYSYFENAYLTKGADQPIANGIKSVKNTAAAKADSNAPIYNVAGQRVNSNARGILIQNGKKFIVK